LQKKICARLEAYLHPKFFDQKEGHSESVRLSFLAEMITEAGYLDYLKIEREVAEAES
jgi:hypothetical protein